MSANTGIEWTDATWNPIRGCSRVSEGCRNCYAEKVAYRFSGTGRPYEGLVRVNAAGERKPEWNGQVRFIEKHLLDPLKWGGQVKEEWGVLGGEMRERPRRIFVNSMSDLFHENVPDEWIDRIFAVMALCPQHIFQVLTKQPERMRKYLLGKSDKNHRAAVWMAMASFDEGLGMPCPEWPLPNVWLGVSVEDQDVLNKRVWTLLKTPAAVRFLSAEPLLGPLDLNAGRYLDWVIVGGESGPGARPMHPDWVRSLRDQCHAAGVPFFFKQWGEWCPTKNTDKENVVQLAIPDSAKVRGRNHAVAFGGESLPMFRVGKKTAGALLDGREWREFPEVLA